MVGRAALPRHSPGRCEHVAGVTVAVTSSQALPRPTPGRCCDYLSPRQGSPTPHPPPLPPLLNLFPNNLSTPLFAIA